MIKKNPGMLNMFWKRDNSIDGQLLKHTKVDKDRTLLYYF